MAISSIFQQNDASTAQTNIPNVSSNSYVDTTDVRSPAFPIPNLNVPTSYSGFRILITVNVDATTDVSETFDLLGTSDGSQWAMSQNSVQSINGTTNVVFSIDPAGQISYTSTVVNPGFVKRTLQWLKQVL